MPLLPPLKPYHKDFQVGDLIQSLPDPHDPNPNVPKIGGSIISVIELTAPAGNRLNYAFYLDDFTALVVPHNHIKGITHDKEGNARTDVIYTNRRLSSLLQGGIVIPVQIMTGTIILGDVFRFRQPQLFKHYEQPGIKVSRPLDALLWNTDGTSETHIYYDKEWYQTDCGLGGYCGNEYVIHKGNP